MDAVGAGFAATAASRLLTWVSRRLIVVDSAVDRVERDALAAGAAAMTGGPAFVMTVPAAVSRAATAIARDERVPWSMMAPSCDGPLRRGRWHRCSCRLRSVRGKISLRRG